MKDLNLEGNRDLATFVWPKVQKSLHYPSINEGNILNDMHHPRAWFKTPKKRSYQGVPASSSLTRSTLAH